jgi:hypothetical protein
VPHVTDQAAAIVTVAGSLSVSPAISLTLSVDFKKWSKNEVLGIPVLSAEDFGGSVGLTYEEGPWPRSVLGTRRVSVSWLRAGPWWPGR